VSLRGHVHKLLCQGSKLEINGTDDSLLNAKAEARQKPFVPFFGTSQRLIPLLGQLNLVVSLSALGLSRNLFIVTATVVLFLVIAFGLLTDSGVFSSVIIHESGQKTWQQHYDGALSGGSIWFVETYWYGSS
jgi:hypothetical protein